MFSHNADMKILDLPAYTVITANAVKSYHYNYAKNIMHKIEWTCASQIFSILKYPPQTGHWVTEENYYIHYK